jgi:hypothetical protein
MITINDPKLGDILCDLKPQEFGVLGLVLASVGGTIYTIRQYNQMDHASIVYTVALIWIIAAVFITYLVTVREIRRIQKTHQSLEFKKHSIAVKINGYSALNKLNKLTGRAIGFAYGIKSYVLIAGALYLIFLTGLYPAKVNSVLDLVRIFEWRFSGWSSETKHVLMYIAIIGQIVLVFIVIWYDHLLHKMNHEMTSAYKPEVFTDKAPTLYWASDADREEMINNVRSVKLDLEIATLSLIAIDCPVFVGVTATAFLEIYFIFLGLPDPLHLFAIGISTGALALHIIAANVMFMILQRLDASNLTPKRGEVAPQGVAV